MVKRMYEFSMEELSVGEVFFFSFEQCENKWLLLPVTLHCFTSLWKEKNFTWLFYMSLSSHQPNAASPQQHSSAMITYLAFPVSVSTVLTMVYEGVINSVVGKRGLFTCRIASLFLLQRLKGSMSGNTHHFNNMETRAVIKFFFLQGKAPKEIHAILTETFAYFLPGRAKDLSAPLYIKCHDVFHSYPNNKKIAYDKRLQQAVQYM